MYLGVVFFNVAFFRRDLILTVRIKRLHLLFFQLNFLSRNLSHNSLLLLSVFQVKYK